MLRYASKGHVRSKYCSTLPRTKMVGIFPELPRRRWEGRVTTMLLLVFVVCTFLSGCKRDSSPIDDYSEDVYRVCIDGHVYYRIGYAMSIKLDGDGKPVGCGK